MSDEKDESHMRMQRFRAHYHSAKIEEILNDLEKGRIEPKVARISIDARKWLAAKMYPKFSQINLKLSMICLTLERCTLKS